jgi:lipopolysaccharide transport system ATP-binding protein
MNNAITVEHVSKSFRLGRNKGGYRTLRESIMDAAGASWNRIRRLLPGSDGSALELTSSTLWALKDVSFKIEPGEAIGIIGRNGAGKSTLLKVMSRIVEPTTGRLEIRGRLGSLLEVGTGFHPELTGRENIYLNGAILNMSRREIARKFDEIVAFAEIENHLDTPVKRYSSGMYVRLGFAVAAHMDPDVLLIDEVLSVGDLKFQRKCMDYAKRLRQSDRTVLIVSHNMFAIKAMCSRVLVLSSGKLSYDGSPEEAIRIYEKDSRLGVVPWATGLIGSDASKRPIHVTDVELLSEDGQPRTVFDYGERMRIRLHYQAPQPLENPNFVVAFIRSDNVACCNYTSELDGYPIPSVSGQGAIELLTPPLKLISELYALHLLVWDADFRKLYCAQEGMTFHVKHPVYSTHFGVYHERAEWQLQPDARPPVHAAEMTPSGL